ncbi:hypothetical protein ACRN9G_07455 [Shewanella frigidimarina]|uniref:hypothetical protein n=1 Tax=Shewanella frigidimarina TaxID=56812 RepID=UPI003D78D4FD
MSVLSVNDSVELNSNNKSPSKMYTNLKILLIAFICLIILLVVDYMLAPSAEQFGESDLLPTLPLSSNTSPSAKLGVGVITEYSQFEKPEAADVVTDESELDDNTSTHLSLEEQKTQSGLLRQLYIGNLVYRLSGIVKSTNSTDQYKAALSLTYLETPIKDIVKVTDNNDSEDTRQKQQKTYVTLAKGEQLSIYTVESVSHKRIVLNDNGRKLWLELFMQSTASEN